jgi:hypothetical protein
VQEAASHQGIVAGIISQLKMNRETKDETQRLYGTIGRIGSGGSFSRPGLREGESID